MPIVAVCPSCNKQYQVNEKSIGKSVRCKACQNVFVVKEHKEKAVAAVGTGLAASKTTSQAANSENAKQLALQEKRFGLKPLPKNPNWSMPSVIRGANSKDPLANHVVTDPGFPFVSAEDYVPPGMEEEKSVAEQYMEKAEEELYGQDEQASEETKSSLYAVYGSVIGLPIIGMILALVASLTQMPTDSGTGWGLLMGAIGLSVISSMILNIYALYCLLSNAESMEVVLSFVIPLYYLYIIFKYFHGMKHVFILSIILPVIMVFGWLIVLLVCALAGGGNIIPAS